MTECTFESLGDGRYRVTGELGFGTVPAIWEQSRSGLDETDSPEIDLGPVTNVDSAGLALVIEWLRVAREKNQRLAFVHMPEKLLALARISELEGVFDGILQKS